MLKVNPDYLKLRGSFLFSTIAKKVATYGNEHPEADIIRLGRGDVTEPITPTITQALCDASKEMGKRETFRGYAPDLGYEFLRNTIVEKCYSSLPCKISPDEIFISDGSKSDSGNIQEIFSRDCRIAVTDPVFPVYVDSNIMAGRAGDFIEESGKWSNVIYMPCTPDNNFCPEFPEEIPDVIYLCSPNNPTGEAMTKSDLQKWVDWANEHHSLILFDAAYEAYISEENIPHSIYECEGALSCAIEMRSFSKNAGFTGVRLGYTVVPHELKDAEGNAFYPIWARRHGTKFNGAPYIQQRAGEIVLSEEGQKEVKGLISFYMENAKTIVEGLKSAGYSVYGGVNAPYIWLKVPDKMTSWEFFDYLLEKANVVGTPGSGFGPSGEGYFRLTAFGSHEKTIEAIERIKNL